MKATALLMLLLALAAGVPCRGIEPEMMEGVVYRLDSFAIGGYAPVYAPPQVEEICLLAGADNALDPRHTLVYYWPLTREYFQAWERLDVEAGGRLEVLQGGRVLRTLTRQPVGFHTPAPDSPPVLVAGEAALARRAADAERERLFSQQLAAFGQGMVRYQAELREYLARSRRGERVGEPPRRPAEPEAPRGKVSELKSAFVLNLPAGSYALRLRAGDGTVVEGSERRLAVFAPLAGEGVGYEVLPEERWTARLAADTSGSGIYCVPGKDLFIIPHRSGLYPEDRWLRLRSPQLTGLGPRPVAVHVGALETARLVLLDGARVVRRYELKPWYVRQVQGAELGYRIIEHDPQAAGGDSATFRAFRLRFEPQEAGRRMSIALEDAATGVPLSAGRREVHVVGGERSAALWLVPLAPLAAGLGILIWRRRLAWDPGQGE